MRNVLKVLIAGLVVVLAGVAVFPLVRSSAQEEGGKTLVGPDAALFHVDGGIEIWVPGATPEVWDRVIVIPADVVECYNAIDQSSTQSDTQTALAACNQLHSQRSNTASTARNNLWLVAQSGKITVYWLPGGGFQVNNGPQQDGKVDVAIFDEGFTYVSQYNLDPSNPDQSTGGGSGDGNTTPVATGTDSGGATSTPVATVTTDVTTTLVATSTDVVETATLEATSTIEVTVPPVETSTAVSTPVP